MNASALARLPFLHGVPQPTIAAVKRVLRPLSVTAGTVLFRTGDDGDTCYVVEQGSLRVMTSQHGQVLAIVGPGSFVGELAVLLGEPRSATVVVEQDARLLALSRRDLHSLMTDHSALAVAVSRELGRRIVHTNQRFAGGVQARRSVVWPPSYVREVAAGIHTYDRRVAAAAIGGATLGRLPDGVQRVKAPGYGESDQHLDAVLIGVGDSLSARSVPIVTEAQHVLCFGAPPPWLRAAAPPNRLVRLEASPLGVRRAVRWATGRAVGLALSSGGSKAVAHMGVLRVLRDAGVEIDAVAGSSGGAIAALYVGFDVDEPRGHRWIADVARHTALRRLDMNMPPRSGLARGRRLHAAFAKWQPGAGLEDATIPLWLVGSDVATGGAVVMHDGPIADALRASLSIPGVFEPWRVGDKLLMDGAVSNPLPTDVLRDAGLGIVLASNVAGQASEIEINGRLPGLGAIVGRVINTMERERIRSLLPLADVVIRPRLSAASSFDFSDTDAAVAAGVTAAEERLEDVRSLLAAASGHG